MIGTPEKASNPAGEEESQTGEERVCGYPSWAQNVRGGHGPGTGDVLFPPQVSVVALVAQVAAVVA